MNRSTVIIIAVVIIVAIIAGSVAYYYSMMSHPSVTMTSSSSTTSTSMTSSSATSSSGVSTTTKTITIVGIGKGPNPYWYLVGAGMQVAANQINQEYGSKGIHVNLIYWFPPTGELAPPQVQEFETLLSEGVNAIAVAPVDPNTLTPYINQAIAKGIPVVTFDTDDPNSSRLAFIGTNNYLATYQEGLVLYQLAKQRGIIHPGATIKVLIVTVDGTSTDLVQRLQGTEAGLLTAAKYDPQIHGNITFQFIGPYFDHGNPSAAVSNIISALEANPDIQIVVGNTAYEVPPIEQAFKELGIPPGKVLAVGFDLINATVAVVKDGYINLTVAQSPYLMGYYATWLLFNMTMMGWQNALKQFIPGYPSNTIYYTPSFLIGLQSENVSVFTGPNNITTIPIISLRQYAQIAVEEQIPYNILEQLGIAGYVTNTSTSSSSAQILLPLFTWKDFNLQCWIFSVLQLLWIQPVLVRNIRFKLT